MKKLIQIVIAASLITAGIARAQTVNPGIHVLFYHNSGPPFIFTNYVTITPVLNMSGPNQWQTNHNSVGDICVVEDFAMMARTWVWAGNHRQYQDTPQQIAYREAAYALEIKAQKMAFYSNPFNVQKLDIVKTLYTPLIWGVVIGCFSIRHCIQKTRSTVGRRAIPRSIPQLPFCHSTSVTSPTGERNFSQPEEFVARRDCLNTGVCSYHHSKTSVLKRGVMPMSETMQEMGPFFIPAMILVLIVGLILTKNDKVLPRTLRIGLSLFFIYRGFQMGSVFSVFAFILAILCWVGKITSMPLNSGANRGRYVDEWDADIQKLSKLVKSQEKDKARAFAKKLKKKSGHNPVYIDTILAVLPKEKPNKFYEKSR